MTAEEVPLPAAPIPEEWEPYLRAARPTDDNDVVFTERQVARMTYILGVVLDRGPSLEEALEQLTALAQFLNARVVESSRGVGVVPDSNLVWARIDDMRYYLPARHNVARLGALDDRGLDPYGRPRTGTVDDPAADDDAER